MKTLLISQEVPLSSYGGGHRLLLWKTALETLGECRLLQLARAEDRARHPLVDYRADLPFDFRAGRLSWAYRHLSFAEYRQDPRYRRILSDIHADFPYDLAFVHGFRCACVAPTDRALCMIDVDESPQPSGTLTRTIWPLTRQRLRARAADFAQIFLIRDDDHALVGEAVAERVALVPGFSMSVKPVVANPAVADTVLFVGSTGWHPNRIAIEWLRANSLADTARQLGYTLRLVGSGTETYDDPGKIEGAGFVENLGEEYRRAAVVMCPVQGERGANIKLAEAAQSGCAVLAHVDAATAFAGTLKAERDIVTYRTAEEARTKLAHLLTDIGYNQRIRAAALARATATMKVAQVVERITRRCTDMGLL